MKKLPHFFYALLIVLPLFTVAAQGLRDPTKPQIGNGAKAIAPALSVMPVVPVVPPMPRLQMVLIGAERSAVVIDGEVLQTGDLFKEMRVEAIRPDAVVLKTRKGLRTLPLYVPQEK